MSSYAKRMFLDNEAKEVKFSDGAYDDEMVSNFHEIIARCIIWCAGIKWSEVHVIVIIVTISRQPSHWIDLYWIDNSRLVWFQDEFEDDLDFQTQRPKKDQL